MPTPKRITYTLESNYSLREISKLFQTTEETILLDNPHISIHRNNAGAVISVCPGSVHPDFLAPAKVLNSGNRDISALKENMRIAWIDHVYWTRLLLISIAHSLPDLNETQAKLLSNPKQIADLFEPYYGQDTAAQIERLITEHLEIGAKIIIGLKNNSPDVEKLVDEWYMNADKIAKALSSINPYYNEQSIRQMLYSHLDVTTKEVTSRLSGDFAQDIKDFEIVKNQAIMMADAFTEGIRKQFYEK